MEDKCKIQLEEFEEEDDIEGLTEEEIDEAVKKIISTWKGDKKVAEGKNEILIDYDLF